MTKFSDIRNLDYLEELNKKVILVNPIQKDIPLTSKEEPPSDAATIAHLKRIESKQNAILEILQCMPIPSVSQVKLNDITEIVIDENWKISLDRGLDIFQTYEMNNAFELANRLQEMRTCKAFEITYIKL